MNVLYLIFLFIELVWAIFLLLPVILLLVHYFRKLFAPDLSPWDKEPVIDKNFRFAAMVTAYQDTRFIAPLVDSLLKQTYDQIKIFVIADDCDISTLHFDPEKVLVLRPDHPLRAKIKSINYALGHFDGSEDVMVIFDADNLVHPKFFEYLNSYFRQGYLAVQAHMLSKNTSTKYARLDSIGHIYFTFLERQMRMELGLSACILGLGIAIDISLYKKIIYKDYLGGFDKKLQADIVKAIPQVAFAKEAIVFDEKVDDGPTLERQRIRWLFTYFQYFRIHWNILWTGIRKGDLRLAYFGFNTLRPPMIILVGAGLLFAFVLAFIHPIFSKIWILILLVFIISYVIIIVTQSRQKGMASSLLYIPLFVFRQVKAMFNIKRARKEFLSTEHTKVIYIEELLNNELL